MESSSGEQTAQLYRGRPFQYTKWTSWTDFVVIAGFPTPSEWDLAQAVEELIQHMPEHAGVILGLPEPPECFKMGKSKSYEHKRMLAEKLVKRYPESENFASWSRLLARIEDEGDAVSVMKSVL